MASNHKMKIQTFKILFILLIVIFVSPEVSSSSNKGKISESIPDVFVLFDTEKETEYAIVVEKSTQQLFLYAYDGVYREIYRTNCSTGEVSGAKTKSGDKKTPEGVYFFIKEYKKEDLSPIYGTRSFPVDYPNILDRIAGHDGNAIWMHGTNEPIKPYDSNGCIALENDDIDKLAKYITLNRTPIIIVDKLSYLSSNSVNGMKESFLNFLSQSNDALEKGTYHEYLKYYDHEYVPDISWWADWDKLRKKLSVSYAPFSVKLERASILKHKEVYIALFDLYIIAQDKRMFAGTKKLFLADKGNHLKIIGEEYQYLLDKKKKYKRKNPLITAGRNMKLAIDDERNIPDMIDGWLKAWSSKDIKRYANYYSKDFRSQEGVNLRKWLRYKNRLNRKYDYIHVSGDNLVINKDLKRGTVFFVQTYVSSGYSGVGIKKLIIKRENGQWKIYRETWEKM